MNNSTNTSKGRTPKDNAMIIFGVLCGFYLLNPTFGVFEILPDQLPLIGNLDEAAATAGLLFVFRYFGWDFGKYFLKK